MNKAANKFTQVIGNKVLLGTNIISALLNGDAQIANKIGESNEADIAATVIGEFQDAVIFYRPALINLLKRFLLLFY